MADRPDNRPENRPDNRLNMMLTINTVLISLLLIMQFVRGPSFVQQADAGPTPYQGVPNAAQQRLQMIDLLKQVNASIESSSKALRDGSARVQVTNLDEIDITVKSSGDGR